VSDSPSDVVETARRLMAAYQAGDPAAFDALYAVLAPPLRRYLTGLTRDAVQAEDLLQETFLRMHKVRHTYDPTLPVGPWAYAIARHVFLMARRRALRAREAPPVTDDHAAPASSTSALSGTPSVATYDLARALDELPPDRREAVVLHHVWGFRFDEIASRLGIREGAARLRAHRGIKSLRQFFKRGEP
jgi:RNA polymerase sigma-70 factor, ECF subfamily